MEMYVEVDLDIDELQLVLKHADKLGQEAIANDMLADMQNYVPRRDGFLRTSGHVSANNEYLIWQAQHAIPQFYGRFKKYTTPGTGGRWDLVALGNHLQSWERVWVRAAGLE